MLIPLRRGALGMVLGILLAGCGSRHATIERHVTAGALDSLPRLQVADGRRVCEATGYTPCPLHTALANWIGGGRYVLWEPGRLVRVYGGADSTGRDLGALGQTDGRYTIALGVGSYRGGTAVIAGSGIVGAGNTLVRFDGSGHAAGNVPMPRVGANAGVGFTGGIPVLQDVRSAAAGGPATLRVELLKAPTDTAGDVVLQVTIPWLVLKDDRPIAPTPFFPAVPRYAVDADRSIVWSPGDRFEIHRRTRSDTAVWTLSSDRTGLPVTPEDIAHHRQIIEDSTPIKLSAADIDSMVAQTARVHPVIAGIVIAPGGQILVAGPVTPSRDSVDYIVLTRDGVPTGRFTLPSKTLVLLFAGDSLLVHQPTHGEPWEVRWLQLKPH